MYRTRDFVIASLMRSRAGDVAKFLSAKFIPDLYLFIENNCLLLDGCYELNRFVAQDAFFSADTRARVNALEL
jgi:predicted component of viral defense system (DUF524 family)